jgi:hypothetical protein
MKYGKLFFNLFSLVAYSSNQGAPNILEQSDKPLVISLGYSCEPAMMSRVFNIRETAFPFDWMATYSFEKVCLTIKERFANFLDKKYLSFVNIYLINEYYNFTFLHDYPAVGSVHSSIENNYGMLDSNLLSYLEQMQTKYAKRITRFHEALNGDRSVYFFRTHISPHEAQIFTSLMNEMYPKLIFKLIVVNNKNEHEYNWNLSNVISFWPTKKNPTYPKWASVDEWRTIFIKLGLINKDTFFNNNNQQLPLTPEVFL